MVKMFISGSILNKEIPEDVIKAVDDSRKRNYTILIGDAKGVDKNIQDMLKADNYKNVEVYHVGPRPRNLSDREWIDRRIPVDIANEKFFKNGNYTREAQMLKDKAMSDDADFGLVIWKDTSKNRFGNISVSKGSLNNIYNLLAAYSLLKELGLSEDQIRKGLESYSPTNGRMQSIDLNNNSTVLLNLAKNPAGLNASLAIANSMKEEINYLLVLNDNGADGIDISWIWDTDFNILASQRINNIVCSGKRAKELALRLKYSEVKANVEVYEDVSEAVNKLKSYTEKYSIAIPNYTALVETQRELEK